MTLHLYKIDEEVGLWHGKCPAMEETDISCPSAQ